jgi:hypothetical protein
MNEKKDKTQKVSCLFVALYLSLSQKFFNVFVTKHRPILAHEFGAKLTVTTKTNSAFHITFHGNKDVFIFNATTLQFL